MTHSPLSPAFFYEELIKLNGAFHNGLVFNFNKPEIFYQPPYEQALLGELFINTRNHIGKYQGNYLLYVVNEVGYIRLKINSLDKKCKIDTFKEVDEINDRIKYEKDAIILTFEDFTELLKDSKFQITNI